MKQIPAPITTNFSDLAPGDVFTSPGCPDGKIKLSRDRWARLETGIVSTWSGFGCSDEPVIHHPNAYFSLGPPETP